MQNRLTSALPICKRSFDGPYGPSEQMSVWELAANLTWAIEPEWLQVILQVAARQPVSPEAVAAMQAPRLDRTR
jgi:hypothetical protein